MHTALTLFHYETLSRQSPFIHSKSDGMRHTLSLQLQMESQTNVVKKSKLVKPKIFKNIFSIFSPLFSAFLSTSPKKETNYQKVEQLHRAGFEQGSSRSLVLHPPLDCCIGWGLNVEVKSYKSLLIQRKTIMCFNLSHVMRKLAYALCEQRRRRSACASVQSDQRLLCSLPR